MLRAQVSPHFLYNSLNTINYLAKLQKAENISLLVSSLIHLLQGAVQVDERLVTLSHELDYVTSYCNIQQYRFPQPISLRFSISEEARTAYLPKMILQPLVENAIIHGLKDSLENGIILIKAFCVGGHLQISVIDNGAGMDPKQRGRVMSKHPASPTSTKEMRVSGIGIHNVNDRIRLEFGEEYGLTLYSQVGLFTRVEVLLPQITNNQGGE